MQPITGMVLEFMVLTNQSSQLVQFCGVPQGIVPGSLIYFSGSSNDPV